MHDGRIVDALEAHRFKPKTTQTHSGRIVGAQWAHCGHIGGTSDLNPKRFKHIVGASWAHCGRIVDAFGANRFKPKTI